MNIPNEINNAFYTGQRSEKIKYVINDIVLVIAGSHEGNECAVISIETIGSEVSYLAENLEGIGDMIIPQAALKLLNPSEFGSK